MKASVSWPELLVLAVMVAVELEKAPLAPEAGEVKVTLAPEMGFPPASLTTTVNGVAKLVLTVAV